MSRDTETELRATLEIENVRYEFPDGSVMQREHGPTPNGNTFDGSWVYRDKAGALLDFNRYRHDLAARFNLNLDPVK